MFAQCDSGPRCGLEPGGVGRCRGTRDHERTDVDLVDVACRSLTGCRRIEA